MEVNKSSAPRHYYPHFYLSQRACSKSLGKSFSGQAKQKLETKKTTFIAINCKNIYQKIELRPISWIYLD